MKLEFPEGFLWGVSTADHQVEGHSPDDWSAMEKAQAKNLAQTAEKRMRQMASILGTVPPDWDELKEKATDPFNYISGEAANHYSLYEQDFDLIKDLNLNAYRFSISWARVEPVSGVFDEAVIEHYRKMIKALVKRGITPFVTINHYTLPVWFANNGGWLQNNSVKMFERYVRKIVGEYKEDVKFWLTLNEPVPFAFTFYVSGGVPPASHWHWLEFYRALRTLAHAHKVAYSAIKEIDSSLQVSVVDTIALVQRRPGIGLKGHLLADLYDYGLNRYFLNLVKEEMDFLAINHYFRFKFKRGLEHKFEYTSDLGWELYPQGLGIVAMDAYEDYKLPVYITEHGLADRNDRHRTWFITEALKGVHAAIADGADIRGYFHWSLMDNFEWDKGWWPEFGLIKLDRETQKRTLRESAHNYAQIAKDNAIYE